MKLPNTPFARRVGSIVTRWTHSYTEGTTGYRYYGTCSVKGCGKEISLYKYNVRQEGNLRCRLCSKIKGEILGVPVYNARLWANRNRIIQMRYDGQYWRAYIKCRVEKCNGKVLFRNERYKHANKPNHGYCREHIKQRLRLRPFEYAYNRLVRRSPDRGLDVTLSYAQFMRLFQSEKCHYCDAALERKPHNVYAQSSSGADHIDRKDPRIGYTPTNCVPCCPPCNFAKNVYYTYEEMLVVGALRQGDTRKAALYVRQINTAKNAKTAKDMFDRVWGDRKGRKAIWKRPATPPK